MSIFQTNVTFGGQTGITNVGVNMTTAVMFTRVPSSYYLSAQAELAKPGFLKNNFGNYPAKEDYLRSFGHSPEFTPYAEVYNDILPDYDRNLASVIAAEFTYCHNPLTERYKSFTPARVLNYKASGGATDFNCCGDCKLAVSEIRLLYFPAMTTASCPENYGNATSKSTIVSSQNLYRNLLLRF